MLLAPTIEVADYVAATYTFDEVVVAPVVVTVAGDRWQVRAGDDLPWTSGSGPRIRTGAAAAGWSPRRLATSPGWAAVVDPVARVLLRGVRTRGTAPEGRREWYAATDLHAVTHLSGTWRGRPLGELRPVDPPCRFGFSSTPRTPGVTTVVTTVERNTSGRTP